MNAPRFCVIMAGGAGTRFWPMSRREHPKQFIDILGTGETLLQSTWKRVMLFCPPENVLVVTGAAFRDLVKEQLPELDDKNILLEPVRRDTAPCIAYACARIAALCPEALVAVLPSDHLILESECFARLMEKAYEEAHINPALLTLGIKPTRPDTGYGYIQFDQQLSPSPRQFYKVKTFTEKPDLALAEAFLQSGDFLWNSGMFLWQVASIEKAFHEKQPELHSLFFAGNIPYYSEEEQEYVNRAYQESKAISIDYAIMEKASDVYVMPMECGWSDLGTWSSLYEVVPKKAQEMAYIGRNIMDFGARHCLVTAPKEKLVVLGAVSDLIIAEYDDMLLVCRIDEEQRIKHFVNEIRIQKGEKFI
ncbi:MAG: mannose-1-phosphate guanylyltransferase [Flavobacteriales bacterium]|nr:mannose-1-phosphate guanylyltransferase [Flavobacteriales bacterium]MCX7651120.1 mannose-1-phosphate guanylyltransferase [Flavobacteriales bacterium]MDW8431408.1 mannose-1-phosphate guanylyltransferase [Flavobacteriales bacterium]